MKRLVNQKQGLSAVVTTLIIILLVIVAVGIVWVVVKGTVDESAGSIEKGTKCIGNSVKATKLTSTAETVYDLVVERESGDDEIEGIKIIFTNETGEANYVHSEEGNIAPLNTKSITDIDTGITNVNKVEVHIYFEDESGGESLCEVAEVKEF